MSHALLLRLSGLRRSTQHVAALTQCHTQLFSVRAQPEGGLADAFSSKLQSKTERELMELLERQNEQSSEVPQKPHAGGLSKGSSKDGKPREYDGPRGPEPTRHGDWEQKGRCTDF